MHTRQGGIDFFYTFFVVVMDAPEFIYIEVSAV